MHAINGTVGDPAFQAPEVEVYEVVLTIRIPTEDILDDNGLTDQEKADSLGELAQDALGMVLLVETGVRSRRVS